MRALFVLTLGMLLASSALAQPPEKPNEFFVGVGDAGLIFAFEEVVVSLFTLSQVTYEDEKLGFAQLSDELETSDDEDARSTLGFHIIPVGIRVGRDVAAFAEFGLGWHGFLKAGLSNRF